MALGLCDPGHPVDQVHPRHEALELDLPGQSQASVRLLGLPARNLGQHPSDLSATERRGAGLALHAVSLGQWRRHPNEDRTRVGRIVNPMWGRLAQWKSARLTRERSLVRTPPGLLLYTSTAPTVCIMSLS